MSIGYTLPAPDESENSPSILRLREIFTILEISPLSLESLTVEGEFEDLEYWLKEIADLIGCLFCTLPAIEMVMEERMARQRVNAAVEERDIVLVKSDSQISIPNSQLKPAKNLFRIDLQLVAAMQESLRDSKFARYMGDKALGVDLEQLHKDYGEQGR